MEHEDGSMERESLQMDSEMDVQDGEGSPGNAEQVEDQLQEVGSEIHVEGEEVEQEAAEETEQQRVQMLTGQSFGDIGAGGQRSSQRGDRQSQDQTAGAYQETFNDQMNRQMSDLDQVMNQDLETYFQNQEGADGSANFLISNWQQEIDQDVQAQKNHENQSQGSFGTGSFTTNTFNARLAGSHGMAILKYVQSEDFGKYGESIKLVERINEFMTQLAAENTRLEEENTLLQKSNEQFTGLTNLNQGKLQQMVNKKHHIAREVTDLEQVYHQYDGAEGKFTRKEKSYKRQLYDLVEYVKWITDQTSVLRERVRKAEAVISSLRKSGESSVESLLKTLYKLRQQQEKLEAEADLLRMHVRTKETMIKMKEDEKGNLKATLENEKRQLDHEIKKLRNAVDDQKALIGNQRKLLNKLQVLNEVTQGCITQSSLELANKNREKQALSLQINDQSREQEKLQKRHNYLQNEIKNCIPSAKGPDGQFAQKYSPEEVTILPDQHRVYNIPTGKYVNVNKHKVRSKMSIFSEVKNPISYDNIAEPRD